MDPSKLYKDAPLKLVDITEEGQFELTSEGITFLSSLKNKSVSVLSITGPYRSGKSFLANLVMNKMAGFEVGSTTNACTKGLWVWGRPVDLENGGKLIIIDSEGLGSVEKDRNQYIDMKIFSLSVLLSSTLIYNTKYAINEERIEELSNAANLSKRINISKDKKENLRRDFGDYFPDLVWVLRDFSLDKGNMSAKDYMENALQIVDCGKIEGGAAKNAAREVIKKNFRNRDCYTLIIPTTDEQKLKHLESEPQSSLRREFLFEVKQMADKIKRTIKPKKINNIELDGEALFGILQSFIEAMNNDEIPVILSALDSVLLSRAKAISEDVFEKFKDSISKKLQNKLPLSESKIYSLFFEQQSSLVSNFCSSIKDTLTSNQISHYITKLFLRMCDELETILESNVSAYEEFLQKEKEQIMEEIKVKPIEKIEGVKFFLYEISNQISGALNKFTESEIESESGKKFVECVLELLTEKLFDSLRKTGKLIEEIYSTNTLSLQATIDDLTIKNKSAQNSLSQEKKMNELKEKEISETKIKIYELESKLEQIKRKNKEKENEYINNIDTEQQKYKKMENSYMNLIQEKDDKLNLLETQLNKMTSNTSQKNQDLSKENIRLMYEIKKLKEGQFHDSVALDLNQQSVNYSAIQNLYKTFQDSAAEFKNTVNKLNQERENFFKEKYLEKCKEEIDSKTKNWGQEILAELNKEYEALNANYEDNVNHLRKENDKLQKENAHLQDEIFQNQQFKANYEGTKKEIKELMSINSNKDSIIKSQAETIRFKIEELQDLKKEKEEIQKKMAQYKTANAMKEDEFEHVLSLLEAILSKKKDKFNMHYENLGQDTQERVNELKKKYKFKLS